MSDLIDRQQAIDALGEKPLAWTEGEYELGLQNQWQSDVDALKALPSAQLDPKWAEYARWSRTVENMIEGMPFAEPEKRTKKRTETHACDLVSRQAAITIPVMPKEHRHYQTNNLDDAYDEGWFDLQNCIEQLPSAQPEIIRCKNCIYFDRYVDGIEKYQWDGFCADWARNTYEDWFCSRAERRTNE